MSQSATNTIFQTREWISAWLSAYGNDCTPSLISVRDSGGTQGIAPLMVHRRRGCRIVTFIGDGRADYCDLIAPTGAPEVAELLVNTLLESTGWDHIELNNLPTQSPTVDLVRRGCARLGLSFLLDAEIPSPALVVQGHEEDVRATLGKHSVRRRHTYLGRRGTLAVHHLRGGDEVQPLLSRFFEQHILRWRETDSPSLFLDPRNRAFYRTLTANLAGTNWLLFTVVEFNETPIAFHYGFDYDGIVTWYKPSFDPALAARSPGLILLSGLLRYALEQGRKELDFTAGDEPFKKRFANTSRAVVRVRVFRDPAHYQLARAGRRIRSALRSRLGR